MNFRPLIDSEIDRFKKEVPEFTFGQTVTAIMRTAFGPKFTKEDLMNVSDEEFYKHINTALRKEREF
jgi:hypothetical protein